MRKYLTRRSFGIRPSASNFALAWRLFRILWYCLALTYKGSSSNSSAFGRGIRWIWGIPPAPGTIYQFEKTRRKDLVWLDTIILILRRALFPSLAYHHYIRPTNSHRLRNIDRLNLSRVPWCWSSCSCGNCSVQSSSSLCDSSSCVWWNGSCSTKLNKVTADVENCKCEAYKTRYRSIETKMNSIDSRIHTSRLRLLVEISLLIQLHWLVDQSLSITCL